MYKNIIIIFAIMGLSACTERIEERNRIFGNEPVSFSAMSLPSGTRTIVSAGEDSGLSIEWAEDDPVGIYGFYGGSLAGANVQYTASPKADDATQCSFSAVHQESMFTWQHGVEQNYYAYCPWSASADMAPVTSHPVSLSDVQVQKCEDSPDHIADYSFMVAKKNISSDEIPGSVQLAFSSIFSIVEFRFKIDEFAGIDSVPLKFARLISEDSYLAWSDATVDLTADMTEDLPVKVNSAGKEVRLIIEESAGITKKEWHSIYFIVAPGSHSAGSLKLELTAIDNSVNVIDIPDKVTFVPNRHYVKEYILSVDSFMPAEILEVDIPLSECKVGEPFTINLKGDAESVYLWTGEEGHDYEYSNKDRMLMATMTANFKMALNSGVQRHPVKIKYSTDFSGEMTEKAINEAEWTDVSDRFDITTSIYTVDVTEKVGVNTIPHDSGVVDCSDWFDNDKESCTIAFFYHVDRYDENYVDQKTGIVGNGRTYFYLFDMWIKARYEPEENGIEIYRHAYDKLDPKPEHPVFVKGSSFDSTDGTNPFNVYDYVHGHNTVRFGAAFRPITDKDSWLVLPELRRPEPKNAGPDKPVLVKSENDRIPSSYSYVFRKPGTYDIVVVGVIPTLSGDKEIIKKATVIVKE